MPGIIPNDAELAVLEDIFHNHDFTLRLFNNDIVPDETTTAGSFTEPAGGGYANKSLPGEDWTLTPGSPTTASFIQQAFNFTAVIGTIYGYYITDETGRLRGCERFTEPFATAISASLKINPRFNLS